MSKHYKYYRLSNKQVDYVKGLLEADYDSINDVILNDYSKEVRHQALREVRTNADLLYRFTYRKTK